MKTPPPLPQKHHLLKPLQQLARSPLYQKLRSLIQPRHYLPIGNRFSTLRCPLLRFLHIDKTLHPLHPIMRIPIEAVIIRIHIPPHLLPQPTLLVLPFGSLLGRLEFVEEPFNPRQLMPTIEVFVTARIGHLAQSLS